MKVFLFTVVALVAALAIAYVFQTRKDCEHVGGILARGVIGYICVVPQADNPGGGFAD